MSRLRPILCKLISHCQYAFIPGRWIAENEIIVQELLHSFRQRKVKNGLMAVKLDLQKAYDRVNWSFLKTVLANFGFNETFVGWLMECVTSVYFALLINGGITEHFNPSRGLRQGDLLSPYLFTLCQDVLSRLLEKQLAEGGISGVKASIGGPIFIHVMYVDDIVMFSKANRSEATFLNQCLETYSCWSGQLINRNKSGVFFSKHAQKSSLRSIKQELQMKSLKKYEIYLGAPMFLSCSRVKYFKFLHDKLESHLKGWWSKYLSWDGRCTMLKSVAQALPSYFMSTFEIPSTICSKLDALNRRFWWNPKGKNGRFLALKSWDKLCLPKNNGGLGFRKSKYLI